MEPERHKNKERPAVPEVDRYLAVAEQLHELFLEYRDRHGVEDEDVAWAKAVCEYMDAKNAGAMGEG